ncbi:MAG: 2-oxoglutarate dehydrogenase E1 component [Vicinamibacterales bacterium]
MTGWRDFHGANLAYVADLYERFAADPTSVEISVRAAFERASPTELAWLRTSAASAERPAAVAAVPDVSAVVGAVTLAESIRRYGHLAARLDPLGDAPPGDPSLELSTYGLSEAELRNLPGSVIEGEPGRRAASALEAITTLRRIYCSTTGFDIAQIFVPEERAWLRHAAETGQFRPPADPIDETALLDRITQVEVFERFLHRTFPGKTRFSVEGLDMLVPILDEIIVDAADAGMHHILIGMAHRGRLNVLAHVLKKPYAQILAEFKDPIEQRTGYRIDLGQSGDVKYHSGARLATARARQPVVITMAPNPSHLEFVDPVVVGMARAAGTAADGGGPAAFNPGVTLPILIHGDAAFPGQGIVAETLNLSRLDGYQTGGTIHIIVNNQLGFTATPPESFSTSYASGLARGFKIPIVHVNADDPIACVEAARLALAYRARFKRDFLIDLVGYRRHGHNEGDEPGFTQPLLYQRIAAHPTVREIWAKHVVQSGARTPVQVDDIAKRAHAELEATYVALKPAEVLARPSETGPPPGAARQAKTAVPLERLTALNEALLRRPSTFVGHPKLEKGRERRRAMLHAPDGRTIDWASAEELAFASILEDGVAIRFTGEDVERGTFSQRHAVLHDVRTGDTYTPLQALPQARARFEIHNSALSENAAIGFEYGYSIEAPQRLVLWEAQYGDFVNGAQVILDEFVVSARAKWGLTPSLVLLLPHGYEGQGPDHSTGRPERFLESAADINLRLANCTTAAQYFHLLRRQALLLGTDPLPLVVLTPKSLLRHPLVSSTPRDLAEGQFQPVIDDIDAAQRRGEIRRLLLCSGKIFVDLVQAPQRATETRVAVARVEQLYPFPAADLQVAIDAYPALDEIVWIQEEPMNMGAWTFMRPELETLVSGRVRLRYIGRPRSASPAEGSAAWHQLHQKALVAEAFDFAPTSQPAALAAR